MHKSDRLEFLRRVETARELLLSGMPEARVVQEVSQKLEVTERQGWNYTRKAREKIQAISEVELAYQKAEHVSFRQFLRLKEVDDKNWQGALNVAMDEARLLGLYPAREVHVNLEKTIRDQLIVLGLTREDLLADPVAPLLLKAIGLDAESLSSQ